MDTIIKYSNKILLALAAVMCFAASSMDYFFPMAAVIIRIPDKWGRILTWALFAFFLFDAVVSLLAVIRWHGRVTGVGASNAFWRFVDLRFPDERMQRIYANLVWS